MRKFFMAAVTIAGFAALAALPGAADAGGFRGGPPGPPPVPPAVAEKYDIDHDGMLSPSEDKAARDAFLEQYDADSDGRLSCREMRKAGEDMAGTSLRSSMQTMTRFFHGKSSVSPWRWEREDSPRCPCRKKVRSWITGRGPRTDPYSGVTVEANYGTPVFEEHIEEISMNIGANILLIAICLLIYGCNSDSSEDSTFEEMVSMYDTYTVDGIWEALDEGDDVNGTYILLGGRGGRHRRG
jgi:hypothetical protein